jgi:predicted nucleic acid-binding protein
MYLLDVNIINHIIKEDFEGENIKINMRKFSTGEDLYLSIITYQEILFGIQKGISKYGPEYKKRIFNETKKHLDTLKIINYTKEIAEKYIKIKVETLEKGFSVGDFDLMAAATALEFGYIIVSNDQDFKHIANLKLEDWTVI